MHVIVVRNVCEALSEGLRYLLTDGRREESRAGPVVVAPWPVTTAYERPTERVLTSPIRDANPFFHLAEALWMLAGRDDAALLNNFVRDFGSRFAEPHGRVHGAYGHRWRHALGYDQLDYIVQTLGKDPTSRQCVLQMWDGAAAHNVVEGEHGVGDFPEGASHETGADDLRGPWRDRPCLAGDTILWSPEGDRPIFEVAKLFKTNKVDRWPIYSVRGRKMRLAWATSVWRSGRRKTIWLRFDDGSSLRCTPDHKFYRYEGTNLREVEAGQLRVDDHIQARQRGHYRGYETFGAPVHQQYAEMLYGPIPPGHVVHHDNEVKTDNWGGNLLVWSKSKHDSHHHVGDNNPMRSMPLELRIAKGRRHSASLRTWWDKQDMAARRAHGEKSHRLQNHVIVAVEEGALEDVYDFTAPGFHTAVVGTGIVTHNCNTHAYLRVRRGPVSGQQHYNSSTADPEYRSVLDLTVLCRSNDAIWGAYGANAVHFSVLQEYLAARIGVGVGTLYQVSNNFHAYVSELERLARRTGQDLKWLPYNLLDNRYRAPDRRANIVPMPLVSNPDTFDREVRAILKAWEEGGGTLCTGENNNAWLGQVAWPVLMAHRFRGSSKACSHWLNLIKSEDWRVACTEWVERRRKKEVAGGQ